MRNFLTLLFALLMTFNAHAATTTTNKVQSPSGNLTLDTPSSASSVVIPSNILASDPTKTHSFSGVQINNASVSSTGTDNLTLKAGASGDKTVIVQGTLNPQRMVNHTIATDATTTGSNATVNAYTAPYVRFTNASLVSIDMIPAPAGTGASEVTFFNGLTTDIVFNLETGATAANRVIAPTGTKFTLKDGLSVSMVYNATKSRWVIKGFDGIANTSVVGPWTTYTPTFVGFGTPTISYAKWRQNGQNIDISIKAMAGTVTAVQGSVSLPLAYTTDSSISGPLMVGKFSRGAQTTTFFSASVLASPSLGVLYFGNQTSTTNEQTILVAGTPTGTGESFSLFASVPVNELKASTNTLSSTNGNTSWASCGHTFTDFNGFGMVTNIETQCKRDGDDLVMVGKFTPGTGTAVEARVNLKLNGVTLTSAGVGKIPSIRLAGVDAFTGSGATVGFNLIEPAVGHITFSQQNASLGSLTKLNGSSYTSGQPVSINARIPINGWENSNVIVASLKDTPTTIGSSGSDIQSVYFGSGTNCATLCTTGTCSICTQVGSKITSVTHTGSTGQYNVNGVDGTKYICTGGASSTQAVSMFSDKGASTSSLARVIFTNPSAAFNVSNASVTCIGVP